MPGADGASGNLLPQDGEAYLIQGALPQADADAAFDDLMNTVDWRQEEAFLFGKKIPVPRLTAWYGDHGYSYSGIHHRPAALTPRLSSLKSTIEDLTGASFNVVLINLYRDGQDSMGWHSDDEAVLGPEPQIVSLSLGERRRFHLKHRELDERLTIELDHGSCLIMKGRCQACWQHQVPKTRKQVKPRINLTFRRIFG